MPASSLASFAPYTLPPDDPEAARPNPSVQRWFPASPTAQTSYQSGGTPSFGTSASGGPDAGDMSEGQQYQWETRHGLRVDLLAAFAYVLGPVSALYLLIVETQNDYVRFHAYQSALLTIPVFIFRILLLVSQAPSLIQATCTLVLVICQAYMATRAYLDASRTELVPFHLPVIGQISERWLADE